VGDRVPLIPIAGSLSPWVNIDLPVALFGVGGTLSSVFLNTLEAPGVGGITASVRTATGGGGVGIAATIAQGAKSGIGTVSIVVPDGATLYLRISAASAGSGWLSGWFEFAESGVVVSVALTTLALVKQHAGIAGVTHDALLSDLILSVSAAMQRKMKRQIVSLAIEDERHDSIGYSQMSLNHWPVTTSPAVVVRENAVALGTGEYEIDYESGIVTRTLSGVAIGWATGKRIIGVDYQAGYEAVPKDLVLAATKQVRHEFAQANPSGQDRLGKREMTTPTGGIQSFEPDGWLPSVLQAMAPYTRK
jgi:hypothetical protein